ncbi:MAG: hypothetical protein R2748_25320 [Bryobacterales bacterium]
MSTFRLPLLLAISLCLLGVPLAAQIDEGIRLTADRLGLFGEVGGPTTQTISVGVTVSDPACAEFQVLGANAPWITITPRSATAPSGVFITIDYSTFQPNEERYIEATFESLDKPLPNAGLSCLDPAASGTGTVVIFRQILPITAKLLPGGPRPIPFPSPQILSLSDSTGTQQPVSTFLELSNVGDGSYSYVFEASYSGAASGWLSVSPSSGSVGATPVQHQVIANPVGLPSGTHSAVLRVLHDAAGVPILTIPVSFTLSGPARFLVTPSTPISGTAKRGKQNPASASFTVANTGGGNLSYQVASSVPWMTVTPTTGQSSASVPVTHTVAFNALNLPVGTQTASLTISSNTPGVANNPVVIPVSIKVEPGGTVSVSPTEFDVSRAAGSTEPQQLRLRIESPDLETLSWRASVEPSGVQWLRLLDRGGKLPGTVVAEIDAAAVPRPAQVSAGIVVEAFDPADIATLGEEGGPEQSGAAIIRTVIPVRLQTVTQAATLQVQPSRIEMVAAPSSGSRAQPISIGMGGGSPGLAWQASIEPRRGADVFSLSASSGNGPGVVTVTAQTSGLAAGVYDSDVVIQAGAQQARVPAALLVTAPGQSVLTTGETAITLRGSAAVLSRGVQVANLGDGPTPNLQVRTLEQSVWLSGTPSGNTFRAEAAGSGLGQGVRHGLLEIVASGASNSPQYLPVVYERQLAGAATELALDRGGLAFVSVGGAAPAVQTFDIATSSDTPLRTVIGTSTENGVQWLSASPGDAQASARTPLAINVQADPTGLAVGVHRGRVTVTVPGGPSQSLHVTLVIAPAGPCTPTTAVLAPLDPPAGFRAVSGHPVAVSAGLLDNCGFPLRGGITAASGAVGAALRDMGESGQARGPQIFRGTLHFPASGEADVLLRAAGGGLAPTERRLSGTVVSGADGATSRSATPPVHAATFGLGRPAAPGSIATIFGTGFPTPTAQPSTLPLPVSLNGFSVAVGGRPAPLFFLNATQANLQIPAETPANTLMQSVTRIGEAYLPAETFFTSAAQPGVFALSAGRAVVVNQDGSINSPSNPAARGDIVVAYLTGIGQTLPPVLTNQPAPSAEPFARPALPAAASVGGVESEILFLGMTPGFVGLAQANLRIGANASTGSDVPLVVEVGGYRSPAMAIAVQ